MEIQKLENMLTHDWGHHKLDNIKVDILLLYIIYEYFVNLIFYSSANL